MHTNTNGNRIIIFSFSKSWIQSHLQSPPIKCPSRVHVCLGWALGSGGEEGGLLSGEWQYHQQVQHWF